MPAAARLSDPTVRVARQRAPACDVEGPIHKAVLRFLRAVLPHGFIVQHTPNKPRSKQQGAREKAMGAIAGWPDLMIFGPGPDGFSAWAMEIKPPHVTVPSYQREVHDRLADAGRTVRIVRSIEDARKALADWGLPSREART